MQQWSFFWSLNNQKMVTSEALYFCPQVASQKKIYVSTLLRLQDILTPGGAERRQEPDGVASLMAHVLLNFAFGGGWWWNQELLFCTCNFHKFLEIRFFIFPSPLCVCVTPGDHQILASWSQSCIGKIVFLCVCEYTSF